MRKERNYAPLRASSPACVDLALRSNATFVRNPSVTASTTLVITSSQFSQWQLPPLILALRPLPLPTQHLPQQPHLPLRPPRTRPAIAQSHRPPTQQLSRPRPAPVAPSTTAIPPLKSQAAHPDPPRAQARLAPARRA